MSCVCTLGSTIKSYAHKQCRRFSVCTLLESSVGLLCGWVIKEINLGKCLLEYPSHLCKPFSWPHVSPMSNGRIILVIIVACFHAKGARAYLSAYFGQGVGDIHMTYVRCTGTESRLLSCSYSTPSRYSCSHYEDAGVRCPGMMHSQCFCIQ